MAMKSQRRVFSAAASLSALAFAQMVHAQPLDAALPAEGQASSTASATADQAAQTGANDAAAEANVIEVIGTRYGYQPIDVKQDSPYIVDSVTFDDVEAPTGDNSIAAMVLQVPGVSWVGDGDEPRYITIRGLSADLNVTTLDGLTLATLGENGSGTRRVNLQLIPADISQRVDVYKAFTAEHDSAAIGGLTNIVSRSALNTDTPYIMVDGYGIYSTFKGPAGENSGGAQRDHLGFGIKTALAQRFGSDGQFGVVFTGRYQERVRNSNKNWPDQRTYFNTNNQVIAGPDPDLSWDGTQAIPKFAYGDYSNLITNEGAALKLEWQPRPEITTFAMGYYYRRAESSTMNSTDIIGNAAQITERTENSGRTPISYVQSVVRYNQWDRAASGLLGGLDWTFGDLSHLSLRGGYSRETYKDDEYWTRVRTTSGNGMSFRYEIDGLPQMTEFIGDPFTSSYALNGSNINYNDAFEDVIDLRADYAFNTDDLARGLGFKVGAKWTQLTLDKDVDSIRYVTGGNVDSLMYDPGYSHYGSNGLVVPWINYDQYWNDTPPVDEDASDHYSRIADYRYEEEVANAYAHLQYQTDSTLFIAGLRYDDVSFNGRSPLTVDGELTDEFARPSGGYSHWLPSFNMVHEFDDRWSLRGSISRSIGRPTPGEIVQAETENCETDISGCVITRGNPDLQPRKATNLDLALEHYFNGNNGLIAVTVFHKQIEDDIFTLTTEFEEDGLLNRIRQPMNADSSEVQGIELAYVNRSFGFHENLGASFNFSALQGKTSYLTDTAERQIDQMLNQPAWMANANLTYRIPAIDGSFRISANYQDDFLNGIGANEWADNYAKGRATVDLSFWHKVTHGLMFKYEVDNVFNAKPQWYHGRNVDGSYSQRDHYGQGFYFHVIYTPGR